MGPVQESEFEGRNNGRSDLGMFESARSHARAPWCVWALWHAGNAKSHMRCHKLPDVTRAFPVEHLGNGDLC